MYIDISKYINFKIYCLWIWILTILKYFKIIDVSILYSSAIALLFTILATIYNLPYVYNITKYVLLRGIVILIEIFVFYCNYWMHFKRNKLKTFDNPSIAFNISLFILYNIWLYSIGTNFYRLYFIDLQLKYSV